MAANRFREELPKNAHGKLYEARAAKSMGARLTPASGARDHSKGDMSKGRWLIEAKTTVNESMSLDLGWLVKISEEAIRKGMLPALLMSFVLPDGRPKPNAETEWVMMTKQTFLELTE